MAPITTSIDLWTQTTSTYLYAPSLEVSSTTPYAATEHHPWNPPDHLADLPSFERTHVTIAIVLKDKSIGGHRLALALQIHHTGGTKINKRVHRLVDKKHAMANVFNFSYRP